MSPLEENGVAVPEEASAKEPTLQRAFAEEYRAQAHRMVDFIADYYRDLETFPVMSAVQAGSLSVNRETPREDFGWGLDLAEVMGRGAILWLPHPAL